MTSGKPVYDMGNLIIWLFKFTNTTVCSPWTNTIVLGCLDLQTMCRKYFYKVALGLWTCSEIPLKTLYQPEIVKRRYIANVLSKLWEYYLYLKRTWFV